MHFLHDDVIKWKHFPRNWPLVRGIHRSRWIPPHKGQWRGALMFSLICVWINGWVNNREAGDLRRHRGHCDVSVMLYFGVVPVSTKVPYYITMIKIGSNKSLIHDEYTQFGHIYSSRNNWSSMNTPYHFTHGVGLNVCPAMFSSISFTSLAFLTIKWDFPGLLSSSC